MLFGKSIEPYRRERSYSSNREMLSGCSTKNGDESKMKKLMAIRLFLLMSVWCFSPVRADVTHLDVDFSDYSLGNVAGQSQPVMGTWYDVASWTGTVVSTSGYVGGTKALEVSGLGGKRGVVSTASAVSLASADKIYMALDVYGKDVNGNLNYQLSSGSPGTIANLGFSIYINGTDDGIKFASSTTSGLVRTDTAYFLAEDTWTRFEWEITQSAVAGVGTFSVFASDQTTGVREAIFTDLGYSFESTSFQYQYLMPLAGTSPSEALAINNLVLQSDLTDFPINPIPEPTTALLLGSSALALGLLRRLRI